MAIPTVILITDAPTLSLGDRPSKFDCDTERVTKFRRETIYWHGLLVSGDVLT